MTSGARLILTKLKSVFIESLMLNQFDLGCPIQIKTDSFGYVIDRISSQPTLDKLGFWHPVAFFF